MGLAAALNLPFVATVPLGAALVINEIHVAPDVKTELVEFVELVNPDAAEVDLSGWTLAGGVDFAFPLGARIPPGGYVVVGENPAALQQKFGVVNAFGPWTGRLSNRGERIMLRNAAGALIDEVEYQVGFPWPTVGDAPGYSMELVHPGLDNNLGGNWRPSQVGSAVIQAETLLESGSVWRYHKGTPEVAALGQTWRQPGFDDSTWPTGQAPIGYGENFVRTELSDMQSGYTTVLFRSQFVVKEPGRLGALLLEAQYDDGLKVWINGVNVANANMPGGEVSWDVTASSAIENTSFVPFPLNVPAGLLVAGSNTIAVLAANSSRSASSDFFFDLRLEGQVGPANRGPTPGRQNAVYAENVPPQIRQVGHHPFQPVSGGPVRVTAKVTDPDGVSAVSLLYQVVEPGQYIELSDAAYQSQWIEAAMNDAGTGGDTAAGDGVFTGEVAAGVQAHRRLVRYRIAAQDGKGERIRAPGADDPQPNFAYFVYDGVPAWTGAIQPSSSDPVRRAPVTYSAEIMRRLPVYHLISKKQSVERAMWLDRYGGDSYRWKGTLVYDGQVYDHVGYRARGGVWRYAMGKNMWKFDFNRGHDFRPRDNYGREYQVPWTKLNLGACIQQGDYQHRGEQGMFESVGFRLFNLAGVEAPHSHFVQLRVIDEAVESQADNQYAGDFWGLYLALEQEDGRFLEEHSLPDGNFYKMEGGSGELNNQGATAATDKSDLNAFMTTYRRSSTPDSWWRGNFSLERYYSYQTIVQGIHHYDICYGKNYFYYLNPERRVWSVHPWDLDLTWADNMYDAGCGGTDEFKDRVLNRPAFQLEYRNRVRELRDLLFNTDQAWRLIDDYAALIDDPAGGPALVDADRALWDYHPVLGNSSLVNPSKAGQGRFYQVAATKDFPGMVRKMKDYVVRRGALLDALAEDALIPERPMVTSLSPAAYPANRLAFRAASYSGAYPFAGMKWRVGEVRRLNGATGLRPAYEIETVWESAPITVLTPDVLVPPAALQVGRTYRLRVRMGDDTGRWSHWSDPVEFTVTVADTTGALQDHLRVTEVMFNSGAAAEGEFIELHNTSPLVTLDLAGVTLTDGIEFTFPPGAVLPPLGYVLLAGGSGTDNFAAFRALYGLGADVPVAGPFVGALNNAGEQVVLTSAAGGPRLLEFQFGNGAAWPVMANGAGHSLVPLSAESGEPNLNYSGSWRASTWIGGSPGQADPAPMPGPLLNEILAYPDSAGASPDDWIELFNPGASPFVLGPDWYLSDSATELRKWPLPTTALPPGGRVSYDTFGFGLSKDGEQVFLSHWTGANRGRVVDAVRFEAQDSGWSQGRFPDGAAYWSAMDLPSRDLANREPPLRVTISELMFHPKASMAQPEDNTADEYVELHNPTSASVQLFNSSGVWRVNGGVQMPLPAGTVLEPGGTLLLVNFDPADATALAAFRTAYSLSNPAPRIVGPYQGKLNNSTDHVALEKPRNPDNPGDPLLWVVIDEVTYSDASPWPVSADGTGLSLERRLFTRSGNDPRSWQAAQPSPGQVPSAVSDSDGDGMPDQWERENGLNPALASDAAADPDDDGLSNLDEYRAGTDPQDNGSALRLSARGEGGRLLIHFRAMAGKAYALAYRESLDPAPWQALSEVPPKDETRVVTVEVPLESLVQRYYRVELVASPPVP